MAIKTFPFYHQLNEMDCGPACLRMISKYYGRHYNAESLRQLSGFGKEGVSLLGLSEAAERIGFRSRGVKINIDQLYKEAKLPCIVHWNQNHFVVVTAVVSNWKQQFKIKIADPANGEINYSKTDFSSHWLGTQHEDDLTGSALLIEPMPEFYAQPGEKETKSNWKLAFQYLKQSKWQIAQVFVAMLTSSLLSLVFPFLTQSIVDTGINTQNLQFITIVLFAQLILVLSRTLVDFIRTRILLKLSIFINISLLSDFWIKLTRLPISYFENHHTGDTMQRLNDNKQVQNFMTGSALSTVFSMFNFVIYTVVLTLYSTQLFFVFSIGSMLYLLWIRFFLSIRRKINYQSFHASSSENNITLQLVQGMQELKLNNAEKVKRWEWENTQARIFKLNFRNLNYSQFQQAGAILINQGKDIFITFLVAKLVLEGNLTFGAMLAIQYILGQLSGPIEQMVLFVQNGQDAKISLERLNEIHQLKDEENVTENYINTLPTNKSLRLLNFSFAYPGPGNDPVLKNINLEIPDGKLTAIVGLSGSGKTTLLKILLKYYQSYQGEINIGESNFKYVSPSYWRSQCGTVLQDGYIFSNTIAENIGIGEEILDFKKLVSCCRIANVLAFIESLPNGFNTKLGVDGVGISQGQKQRLLIARAIYKNPKYILFDEATNALDANNEKVIVENLREFFVGRTVLVVAHRLSTVKNADKIVVLHEGSVTEEGTHEELVFKKGKYYELVKNQLDLGK